MSVLKAAHQTVGNSSLQSTRGIRRFLVILLAVGALLSLCQPSAEATSVTMTAQDFNMCSAHCGYHTQTANLVSFFNSSGPWSLSLQEMCYTDPVSYHYTGAFLITKLSVSGCGGFHYGIAVASPNPPYPAVTYYYTNQSTGCPPSSTLECRGMICQFGNVFGLVYLPCSTHLTSDSTSKAVAQSYEYTLKATAWTSSGPRILSGDFNLTAGSVPSIYSTAYYPAVFANTYPSPTPTKQIDFVFPSRPMAYGATLISPYCSTSPYSDHCYVMAQINANL